MNNKLKIISWSAGVLSLIFLLVIAAFVVKHFTADTKDDFCQRDDNEKGKCVAENKCSEITLLGENGKRLCSDDKICCPRNLLFPDETPIIPVNFSSIIFNKNDGEIPVELVGLKLGNGDTRKFENHKKCGTASEDKIYHGEKVKPGEFPFFVALKYKTDPLITGKSFGILCGGSLIGERYVLTAAHCIDPSLFEVRVGELDLTMDVDCEECPPAVDHKIEKILKHSQFNETKTGSDIALLRLTQPVNITRYVKPICLPVEEINRLNESEPMQVMGFGETHENIYPDVSYSDVLLKVVIPFVPIEQCNKIYSRALGTDLYSGQLCAGIKAKKAPDSCRRDSGGPLIADSEYLPGIFRMFQYGIVSFGAWNCGRIPAVHTSIADHIHWIADNMEP